MLPAPLTRNTALLPAMLPLSRVCASVNCDRKGQILAVTEFWGNNATYDGLDQFCIQCRKKYRATREGADTRPSRRDQPPYDFECPVCGIGIDQQGKRFKTMRAAQDCCKEIRDIPDQRRPQIKYGRPRKYDVGHHRANGLLDRILRGSK
jgi:hypothetical protein